MSDGGHDAVAKTAEQLRCAPEVHRRALQVGQAGVLGLGFGISLGFGVGLRPRLGGR
jgi:hypothetical protein